MGSRRVGGGTDGGEIARGELVSSSKTGGGMAGGGTVGESILLQLTIMLSHLKKHLFTARRIGKLG